MDKLWTKENTSQQVKGRKSDNNEYMYTVINSLTSFTKFAYEIWAKASVRVNSIAWFVASVVFQRTLVYGVIDTQGCQSGIRVGIRTRKQSAIVDVGK